MKAITMTDEQHAWFVEAIAEMNELYSVPDDGHTEYWDADDLARDIAEKLGELMDEQEERR